MFTEEIFKTRKIKYAETFTKNVDLKDDLEDESFNNLKEEFCEHASIVINTVFDKSAFGTDVCILYDGHYLNNHAYICLYKSVEGFIYQYRFEIDEKNIIFKDKSSIFNEEIRNILLLQKTMKLNMSFSSYSLNNLETMSFRSSRKNVSVYDHLEKIMPTLLQKYSTSLSWNSYGAIQFKKEYSKLGFNHAKSMKKIYIYFTKKRAIGLQKQKQKVLNVFFKNCINDEDRILINKTRAFLVNEYNVMQGLGTEVNDLEKARLYRKQALDRYPLASKLVLTSKSILNKIDSGQSPEKAICGDNINPKKFREIFCNLAWQKAGVSYYYEKSYSLKVTNLFKDINKDNFPQTKAGWNVIYELEKDGLIMESNFSDFYNKSFGRNRAYNSIDDLGKLVKNNKVNLNELKDLVNTIRNKIVLPQLIKNETGAEKYIISNEITLCLLHKFPLKRIIDFAKEWHSSSNITKYNKIVELANKSIPNEWDTLIKAEYHFNEEYKIVNLKNASELVSEGNNLLHCVATYVTQCLFYNSQIFSVRKNNTPVSTFEIVPQLNGDMIKIKLIQHKAFRNQEPTDFEKQVVKDFIKNIEENRIPVNKETFLVKSENENNIRVTGSLHQTVGFDPKNRNGLGDLFLDHFKNYLPKECRNMNYDQFGNYIKSIENSNTLKKQKKQIFNCYSNYDDEF